MIKYLANIILELQSPLCIASGSESSYSDTQVRRDFNGLPVIPGTSLKGIIKSLASKKAQKLLGKDEKCGNLGSSLVVNDAHLLNSKRKAHTTLNNEVFNDTLLKHYKVLSNREHVRINHLGVTDGSGKFTNAIVYKGSRFQLQLKLEVLQKEDAIWQEILALFYSPDFLIGSQVTNGLGRIQPISITQRTFDLSEPTDLVDFCEFPPYAAIKNGKTFESETITSSFKLHQKFEFTTDAIHIGIGYGDDEVNAANLIEKTILWTTEDKFETIENQYIIPGASIKGVLRHRTFYYLCPAYDWADTSYTLNDYVKLQEAAQTQLETLFGSASENENGHIGNISIEDISIDKKAISETSFLHNSIDSFTGGTIDKALYSEKVYAITQAKTLKIWLSNQNTIEEKVLEAFNKAILDLKKGRLAIGGNTTNGNGFLKVTHHG